MTNLSNMISAFRTNRKGNVVVIFAIMIVPIMLVVGGALDYSNAKSQQANLQNTLDSATLAGARALANGEDVETAVADYLHASWPGEVALPDYKVEVVDNKDVSVIFSQPTVVKTKMLSMFGWGEMPAVVQSVATITSPILDIALVVDRSDSMKSESGTEASEVQNFLNRVQSYNNGRPPNSEIWVQLTIYKSSLDYKKWTWLWLTDNIQGKDGLSSYINDSDAWHYDGNTATAPALQKGLQYLQSPTRCQEWGQACGTEPDQYLVLLSDGDEDSKFGDSGSVCASIRASNVKLLVVAFAPEHGSGDTDRLRACAGDPKNFYTANGNQLAQVLDDIIKEKSQPRLKQ